MEIVKNTDDINKLKENRFIGYLPQIKNSTINFTGKNNVVYCEENVKIENASIGFPGHDGLLYLASGHGSSRCVRVTCTINGGCVCYLGGNTAYTQPPVLLCSEQKHIFIGDNCLLAPGIWMRTADPHLIYSIDTKKRINPSKSIFIGDNVWIGQAALILKGTQIYSGSIVGGGAVLANKKILSNCSAAGNPARIISENIFWEDGCVNNYNEDQTNRSMISENTKSIFTFEANEYIPFDTVETVFSEKIPADEKAEKVQGLFNVYSKNRFALNGKIKKKWYERC